MRISFFPTTSHRVFHYEPLYYSEEKEKLKQIYEKYGKEWPEDGAKGIKSTAKAELDAEVEAASEVKTEVVAETTEAEKKVYPEDYARTPHYVPGKMIRGSFQRSLNEHKRQTGNPRTKTLVVVLTLLAAVVAVYYLSIGLTPILK